MFSADVAGRLRDAILMHLSEGHYNEKLLNFPEQARADYVAGWLDHVKGVRVHECAPLHLFLGMVE
eukprot:324535-Chlamydomonas_euryale.AAC.1